MGDLGQDTNVEGGDGIYTATLSSDWEIWGPMGGYVATVALRAMAAEVPSGLEPASFTCQFLSPARFEGIDIAVEVRRSSRRTAAASARITQDGAAILDAQAWFTVPGDVVTHDFTKDHGGGRPEDHLLVSERIDEPPRFRFWYNLESRPTDWIDDIETYPGGEPEWASWLRFTPTATYEDPVLEACRLVLLADLPSFPAAVRAYPGTEFTFVAPSLDLAVQLHRIDDAGEWLLLKGVAPIAERGLLGFRSEVWSEAGRLLASGSGQLLGRKIPPPD